MRNYGHDALITALAWLGLACGWGGFLIVLALYVYK